MQPKKTKIRVNKTIIFSEQAREIIDPLRDAFFCCTFQPFLQIFPWCVCCLYSKCYSSPPSAPPPFHLSLGALCLYTNWWHRFFYRPASFHHICKRKDMNTVCLSSFRSFQCLLKIYLCAVTWSLYSFCLCRSYVSFFVFPFALSS